MVVELTVSLGLQVWSFFKEVDTTINYEAKTKAETEDKWYGTNEWKFHVAI